MARITFSTVELYVIVAPTDEKQITKANLKITDTHFLLNGLDCSIHLGVVDIFKSIYNAIIAIMP